MEKRFCPFLGRTVNIKPQKDREQSKNEFKNPHSCASMSAKGICTNYFSGCCRM